MLSKWLLGLAFFLGLSSGASAQVYGTDYFDYEGRVIIQDNPTGAACQAHGINYGSLFTVVYRFNTNASSPTSSTYVYDALMFVSEHSAVRMLANDPTNTPPYSLNNGVGGTGAALPVLWEGLTTDASLFAGTSAIGGTAAVKIQTGLQAPISAASYPNQINANFSGGGANFFGISGCNITSMHGVLLLRPN